MFKKLVSVRHRLTTGSSLSDYHMLNRDLSAFNVKLRKREIMKHVLSLSVIGTYSHDLAKRQSTTLIYLSRVQRENSPKFRTNRCNLRKLTPIPTPFYRLTNRYQNCCHSRVMKITISGNVGHEPLGPDLKLWSFFTIFLQISQNSSRTQIFIGLDF